MKTLYKDSCSNKSHSAYEECLKGPVETVGDWVRGYFKNSACALCNGEATVFRERSIESGSASRLPKAFSIVFNADKQSNCESTVVKVVENYCPEGLVYDDVLEYCRKGVVTNIDDTLSDTFLIVLWFKSGATEIPTKPFIFRKYRKPIPNINNITKHLKLALVRKFALKPNQLTAFRFHRQNSDSTFLVMVITFHLKLSPYQEFILANKNSSSSLSTSTESQTFLKRLKFKTKFAMQSGGYRFPVIKLVSQQLACYEGRTLQSHEYEIDDSSGNIIQNTTGKFFSKNECTILGKTGGNTTICRRLVLPGCHNGAFVTLYEHEYFVHQNLTILHNKTNSIFNFGWYQIIEGGSSNQTCLSNLFESNLSKKHLFQEMQPLQFASHFGRLLTRPRKLKLL